MYTYKCSSCGDKFRTYIDCLQHCNWHSPCDMMQYQPKLINWQDMEKLTLQELYQHQVSKYQKYKKQVKIDEEKILAKERERWKKGVFLSIYGRLEKCDVSIDQIVVREWDVQDTRLFKEEMLIYEEVLKENNIPFIYEDYRKKLDDAYVTYRRLIIIKRGE